MKQKEVAIHWETIPHPGKPDLELYVAKHLSHQTEERVPQFFPALCRLLQ